MWTRFGVLMLTHYSLGTIGRPSLRSTVSLFGPRAESAFRRRLSEPLLIYMTRFPSISISFDTLFHPYRIDLKQASTVRASTRAPPTFSSSALASTTMRPLATATSLARSALISSLVSDSARESRALRFVDASLIWRYSQEPWTCSRLDLSEA